MTNVMIKIQLPDRPKQLTKELELELIERFKRMIAFGGQNSLKMLFLILLLVNALILRQN